MTIDDEFPHATFAMPGPGEPCGARIELAGPEAPKKFQFNPRRLRVTYCMDIQDS